MTNKSKVAIDILYEVYKEKWKRGRPASLICESLLDFMDAAESVHYNPKECSIEEYIEETGYHGTMYGCRNEFCDSELCNVEYIKNLVGNHSKVLDAIKEYWDEIGVEY